MHRMKRVEKFLVKGEKLLYPYFDHIKYSEMEAEKMYPEIYHEIYPYVLRVCEREDHMYNQAMHPFPRRQTMDRMVDEIYDTYNKDKMHRSPDGHGGSGNLIKSLIGILLIRELLGRRRRRRPWAY